MTPDEFLEGAKALSAHWNKVAHDKKTPVESIGFGVVFNSLSGNKDDHWIVLFNREPTNEEGANAPEDRNGVPVEYFLPGWRSWTPPKPQL